MKHIIKLMRPHQYIKNLFIFLPLFFSGNIQNMALFGQSFLAFAAFCICASGIYIVNDYCDIEDDRQHPEKRFRPLASGAVTSKVALILIISLFIVGGGLIASASLQAGAILLAYVVMNIAYSFHLKHIAIIDVYIIAIGFVLRLFVGSVVTGIHLSMWIVIMTFLLALFMALAKRRDDTLIFLDTGKKMRTVIDGYNLQFIDVAMMITATVVIVSYIQYTTSGDVTAKWHSEHLYLTAFFVMLGILRYLQIAFVEKDSGSPTRIVLKDTFLQLTIVGWVASFGWIIYQ